MNSSTPLNQPQTFTHNNRLWVATKYINEANTRILTKITPAQKGRPFPTRQEPQPNTTPPVSRPYKPLQRQKPNPLATLANPANQRPAPPASAPSPFQRRPPRCTALGARRTTTPASQPTHPRASPRGCPYPNQPPPSNRRLLEITK